MEETRTKPVPKSSWADTEETFRSLLVWLDNGEASEGQSYIEMRRRLVLYFDRKNCAVPDQLADETLSRVSRRLAEEGTITGESPARYCYITAKFVFLEHVRKTKGAEVALEDVAQRNGFVLSSDQIRPEDDLKERMFDCLESCTSNLESGPRELIFAYYLGSVGAKAESRRSLAREMGITPNALAIKAFRIRAKLETCVSKCAGLL